MHRTSFFSRLTHLCLILICTLGVLSAAFLLLHALNVLPATLFAQGETQVEAAPGEGDTVETMTLPQEETDLPAAPVFLSLDALDRGEPVAAGGEGVVVPMKTDGGELGYVSALPLAADAGASWADPDRNQALRALNAQPGLYTVAQVSCLRDEALAARDPSLALARASGSAWRDENGQAWLDPANPQVLDYLSGLCREIAGLGFDEILLTNCAFPAQGDLSGLQPVEEKQTLLETFCRQLQGALAHQGVALSVAGAPDAQTPDPASGQTPALLATFTRVWATQEDQPALTAFSPALLPEGA